MIAEAVQSSRVALGAGADRYPAPSLFLPLPSTHPFLTASPANVVFPCSPDRRFDPHHPQPTALPVPFVPGALLLQGVLSAAECQQIITAAEAIGWHSDVDYTFGGAAGDDGGRQQQQQHNHSLDTPTPQQQQQQDKTQQQGQTQQGQTQQLQQKDGPQLGNGEQEQEEGKAAGEAAAAAGEAVAAGAAGEATTAAAAAGGSAARGVAAGLAGLPEGIPAAGCVWLVDDSVLQPLYDRVAALLPAEIEGGAYAGINARWRLYRYT